MHFYITKKMESNYYPPANEASREVANLTERKNPHNPVYGVKEFVCLFVTKFDPNYLRTGVVSCVEVCVPELVLNETRQDETGTHFPNWRYRDETNVFWSRHSRKFRKNPGNKRDETAPLRTVPNFENFLKKPL